MWKKRMDKRQSKVVDTCVDTCTKKVYIWPAFEINIILCVCIKLIKVVQRRLWSISKCIYIYI